MEILKVDGINLHTFTFYWHMGISSDALFHLCSKIIEFQTLVTRITNADEVLPYLNAITY